MNTEHIINFRIITPKHQPYNDKSSVPEGRSGHSMCADESDLYVFGGSSHINPEEEGARLLPEVWKFNFAQQKWMEISVENTQYTCLSSSMLLLNGVLFVLGGTTYPYGDKKDYTVKFLKLPKSTLSIGCRKGDNSDAAARYTSGQWGRYADISNTQQPSRDYKISRPYPDFGQSMICYQDSLYIIGGADSINRVVIVYRLNLETRTWERSRPTGTKPRGRYKQEVVQDSEYFYVLGGGSGEERSEGLDIIARYSFTQNHWDTVTTSPDPAHGYPMSRLSFGCSQETDNVYISGGKHNDPAGDAEPIRLEDMWHLRLSTLQWTRLSFNLPEKVCFNRTVITPSGHMYAFGGALEHGIRSHQLYKVRLPFTLPRLTEMCWDHVCDRLNITNTFSVDVLMSIGIPANLTERALMDFDCLCVD